MGGKGRGIDLSIRVEDSLGASLTFRSSEINEPLKRHLPWSDREEIKKTYWDHVKEINQCDLSVWKFLFFTSWRKFLFFYIYL